MSNLNIGPGSASGTITPGMGITQITFLAAGTFAATYKGGGGGAASGKGGAGGGSGDGGSEGGTSVDSRGVTNGQVIAVSVGAGGAAQTTSPAFNGNDGTGTTCSTFGITAGGGSRGFANNGGGEFGGAASGGNVSNTIGQAGFNSGNNNGGNGGGSSGGLGATGTTAAGTNGTSGCGGGGGFKTNTAPGWEGGAGGDGFISYTFTPSGGSASGGAIAASSGGQSQGITNVIFDGVFFRKAKRMFLPERRMIVPAFARVAQAV